MNYIIIIRVNLVKWLGSTLLVLPTTRWSMSYSNMSRTSPNISYISLPIMHIRVLCFSKCSTVYIFHLDLQCIDLMHLSILPVAEVYPYYTLNWLWCGCVVMKRLEAVMGLAAPKDTEYFLSGPPKELVQVPLSHLYAYHTRLRNANNVLV